MTVPPTVHIPEGEVSQSFEIATSVFAPPNVDIVGTLDTSLQTVTLFTLAPNVTATMNVSNMVGASTDTARCTVSIPIPAGGPGVTVYLSADPGLNVPSSVTIPANYRSVRFAVTASETTSSTKKLIYVAITGSNNLTSVFVDPFEIKSVKLSPNPVIGGTPTTMTVTLNATPLSAKVLSLSSTNSSLASVPATLTIPANQPSASTTVFTGTVSSPQSVYLAATYGASTMSKLLKVIH